MTQEKTEKLCNIYLTKNINLLSRRGIQFLIKTKKILKKIIVLDAEKQKASIYFIQKTSIHDENEKWLSELKNQLLKIDLEKRIAIFLDFLNYIAKYPLPIYYISNFNLVGCTWAIAKVCKKIIWFNSSSLIGFFLESQLFRTTQQHPWNFDKNIGIPLYTASQLKDKGVLTIFPYDYKWVENGIFWLQHNQDNQSIFIRKTIRAEAHTLAKYYFDSFYKEWVFYSKIQCFKIPRYSCIKNRKIFINLDKEIPPTSGLLNMIKRNNIIFFFAANISILYKKLNTIYELFAKKENKKLFQLRKSIHWFLGNQAQNNNLFVYFTKSYIQIQYEDKILTAYFITPLTNQDQLTWAECTKDTAPNRDQKIFLSVLRHFAKGLFVPKEEYRNEMSISYTIRYLFFNELLTLCKEYKLCLYELILILKYKKWDNIPEEEYWLSLPHKQEEKLSLFEKKISEYFTYKNLSYQLKEYLLNLSRKDNINKKLNENQSSGIHHHLLYFSSLVYSFFCDNSIFKSNTEAELFVREVLKTPQKYELNQYESCSVGYKKRVVYTKQHWSTYCLNL